MSISSSSNQPGSSPASATADFPFIYLHNEIVKYFQERDREVAEQKQQWLQRLKQSENGAAPEVLLAGPEGKLLTSQIFSQKNAETRLEALGFKVGFVLAEKLSKDMPRFANELDRMKFICKEFWTATFGKGVNKLSTNHQGTYIIQDTDFYTVTSFAEGLQYIAQCIPYLALPAGIVRGALDALGISASVTVMVERLPSVKFNVQLIKPA